MFGTKAWGTGETNFGELTSNLPVYHDLLPDQGPVKVEIGDGRGFQSAAATRLFRLEATGGALDVIVIAEKDVNVQLTHYGVFRDWDFHPCASFPCEKTLHLNSTAAGDFYVVAAQSWDMGAVSESGVTVEASTP